MNNKKEISAEIINKNIKSANKVNVINTQFIDKLSNDIKNLTNYDIHAK